MLVAITIDTEEDDWGSYAAEGATVRNISHLPELQDLFDRYGARPTYFVNRPPLLDERASTILRALLDRGTCEIGTHCHPWNTPPFLGPPGESGSMMYRLTADLNRLKLAEITGLIEERLGVRPMSFRAGRWGFGPTVAGPLLELGYEVDSSVTPFFDWWEDGGPDYKAAPNRPYRFDPGRPLEAVEDGALAEVPVSVGYLQRNHTRMGGLHRLIQETPLRAIKIGAVLELTHLMSRRWLCPEINDAEGMVRLAQRLVSEGLPHMNMTFHSTTLLPGATPFVGSVAQLRDFLKKIEFFLAYCRDEGFRFATVREVARTVA